VDPLQKLVRRTAEDFPEGHSLRPVADLLETIEIAGVIGRWEHEEPLALDGTGEFAEELGHFRILIGGDLVKFSSREMRAFLRGVTVAVRAVGATEG
jgi:hypothetical protein